MTDKAAQRSSEQEPSPLERDWQECRKTLPFVPYEWDTYREVFRIAHGMGIRYCLSQVQWDLELRANGDE